MLYVKAAGRNDHEIRHHQLGYSVSQCVQAMTALSCGKTLQILKMIMYNIMYIPVINMMIRHLDSAKL